MKVDYTILLVIAVVLIAVFVIIEVVRNHSAKKAYLEEQERIRKYNEEVAAKKKAEEERWKNLSKTDKAAEYIATGISWLAVTGICVGAGFAVKAVVKNENCMKAFDLYYKYAEFQDRRKRS